ncbi:uncharacterized protein LOC123693443 [Colias croceus]|uniref:uncharacterized protein LOC123693443 n=1 Tax=Colias crocea TaxID=72248 RepID=UPI001E27B164|nr:uncharacterized protein LOC123693443 [Colias croceus]
MSTIQSLVITLILMYLQMKLVLCDNNEQRKTEGNEIAESVMTELIDMFIKCYSTSMPNQRYFVDNINIYINTPSKTTVGVADKFTTNRKFFANMISTTAFKNMLATDVKELKKNMAKKLRYCDDSIMNQEILNEFYEREVDQTRM